MKKHTTIRDTLYEMLDSIVTYSLSINKDIPAITLNPAQFQIFKEFNPIDIDGHYYYRNVLIRRCH